jgi:hypothetical protein
MVAAMVCGAKTGTLVPMPGMAQCRPGSTCSFSPDRASLVLRFTRTSPPRHQGTERVGPEQHSCLCNSASIAGPGWWSTAAEKWSSGQVVE